MRTAHLKLLLPYPFAVPECRSTGMGRFQILCDFHFIVRRFPRYLAWLSAFIDIRQIETIIVAYSNRKRISPRPVNLAAMDTDGDTWLRLGFYQLFNQCIDFGKINILTSADVGKRIENSRALIGSKMGPFAVTQDRSPLAYCERENTTVSTHLYFAEYQLFGSNHPGTRMMCIRLPGRSIIVARLIAPRCPAFACSPCK